MQVVVMSPRQHRPRARVALFALVAAAALAALVVRPAHAAQPCWQAVVSDWSDGRIDRTYSVDCYREALQRLPQDVRLYSSAEGDIRQALAAAVAAGVPPKGPGSSGSSGGWLSVLLVLGGGVAALMAALAALGIAVRRRGRRLRTPDPTR